MASLYSLSASLARSMAVEVCRKKRRELRLSTSYAGRAIPGAYSDMRIGREENGMNQGSASAAPALTGAVRKTGAFPHGANVLWALHYARACGTD